MISISNAEHLSLVLKQRPGGTRKWPIATLVSSRNAKIRILFVVPPKFRGNRMFSHDVTAAILVSQNNETAAMLVSQTSPVGVELLSYANAFFCSNKFA